MSSTNLQMDKPAKIYKISHKILGDLMAYPNPDEEENDFTCKYLLDIHPEERYQCVAAMFSYSDALWYIKDMETNGTHINDGPFKNRLEIKVYFLN